MCERFPCAQSLLSNRLLQWLAIATNGPVETIFTEQRFIIGMQVIGPQSVMFSPSGNVCASCHFRRQIRSCRRMLASALAKAAALEMMIQIFPFPFSLWGGPMNRHPSKATTRKLPGKDKRFLHCPTGPLSLSSATPVCFQCWRVIACSGH